MRSNYPNNYPYPPPFTPAPQPKKNSLQPWHIVLICVGGALVFFCLASAYLSILASSSSQANTNTTSGNQATITSVVTLTPTGTLPKTNTPSPTAVKQIPPTRIPPTSTPKPTPTPTPKPLAWVTTQTFQGNQDVKTSPFTTTHLWRLEWSCTPSADPFGQYNIIVDIYTYGVTRNLYAVGINEICCSNNTHDTSYQQFGPGTYFLDITTLNNPFTIAVEEYE